MGAAWQPAQHVLGADDGKCEALERTVDGRRDQEPAGLDHLGAAPHEQVHVGDVLDHLHGEHQVEAFARRRQGPALVVR